MPKIQRETSTRALRKSTVEQRYSREDSAPRHSRNTRLNSRLKEEERDRDRSERGKSPSKNGPNYVIGRGGKKRVCKAARPNFNAAFRAEFWKSSAGHGHLCTICNTLIPGKTPQDKKSRGIDHRVDLHTYILRHVDPVECCYGGFHWEVWIEEEVVEAYCDTDNLQPTHKSCNSSKSGPKNYDRFKSSKKNPLVRCDGGCKLPKGCD